jgi:Rieske Fe-S protein
MNVSAGSRRRFIKTFALGTAFSTFLGKPWRGLLLAEGMAAPPSTTATFKVRLSDYPILSQPFGSVRLGVNAVRPEIEPFPDGDYWPLLINRGENNEIYVLDSECQHASCVVPTYDDFFFGMRCPCHGSTYDIDGSILSGPTERPLRQYEFVYDEDDTLTIQVPGLGFNVTTSVLPANQGGRLRLAINTHFGITYQAHFRARVNDPWTVIPFAATPNGPLDAESLFANGSPEVMYVDRPGAMGFYAVSMVLQEV